jgi:hypothetical protein
VDEISSGSDQWKVMISFYVIDDLSFRKKKVNGCECCGFGVYVGMVSVGKGVKHSLAGDFPNLFSLCAVSYRKDFLFPKKIIIGARPCTVRDHGRTITVILRELVGPEKNRRGRNLRTSTSVYHLRFAPVSWWRCCIPVFQEYT